MYIGTIKNNSIISREYAEKEYDEIRNKLKRFGKALQNENLFVDLEEMYEITTSTKSRFLYKDGKIHKPNYDAYSFVFHDCYLTVGKYRLLIKIESSDSKLADTKFVVNMQRKTSPQSTTKVLETVLSKLPQELIYEFNVATNGTYSFNMIPTKNAVYIMENAELRRY